MISLSCYHSFILYCSIHEHRSVVRAFLGTSKVENFFKLLEFFLKKKEYEVIQKKINTVLSKNFWLRPCRTTLLVGIMI